MLTLTYLFFQESPLLGWLIDNHDSDGWEDTAQSWLISGIVIAVLCAGLMMLYKWLKKHSAKNINDKIWSRNKTLMLMLIGLAPVFLIMVTLWYLTRDFFDVVGIGGLFKGILCGWLLYLLFVFIGHVAGPWRREIL